jgi:DNA-binding cell septation regulator SpoVG
MEISDVKVWPLKSNHPTVLANGVFVVEGSFKIKYTLINSKNGPYVGLPGNKGKDGKWYSDVDCLSNEVRKQMTGAVLKEYNKVTGKSLDQGESNGPTDQTSGDNVPF